MANSVLTGYPKQSYLCSSKGHNPLPHGVQYLSIHMPFESSDGLRYVRESSCNVSGNRKRAYIAISAIPLLGRRATNRISSQVAESTFFNCRGKLPKQKTGVFIGMACALLLACAAYVLCERSQPPYSPGTGVMVLRYMDDVIVMYRYLRDLRSDLHPFGLQIPSGVGPVGRTLGNWW